MTTKLVGNESALRQDFVLKTQTLSTNEGFRNVSKTWFSKCISYDQGLSLIHQDKSSVHDFNLTPLEMFPHLSNDRFCLKNKAEQVFTPTEHALGQISQNCGVSRYYAFNLYSGDRDDQKTLYNCIINGWRKLNLKKKFLWRIRLDGTLRAMLSNQYIIVNNEWVLESIKKIIPGGMLSHWRGDSDTLYGNVLIPDTIREDTDSDYGGMLSLGNSEIGTRKLSTMPSIFRAICMNGCIWGQTKGTSYIKVHKGKQSLDQIYCSIKDNLTKQIPLLPQGIDKLLKTKELGWDGGSLIPLFAQVGLDNNLRKQHIRSIFNEYQVHEKDHKNLFGVTNAITRAGQLLGNSNWVLFDTIAGDLVNNSAKLWPSLTERAKHLRAEVVDGIFSPA